jgi:protein gp37
VSDKTRISWTEATWNPASGCTKVSPGCTHCYIDRTPPFRFEARHFADPYPGDTANVGASTGVQLHPNRLTTPLRWTRPRLVFAGSLTDLFHTEIPAEFLAQVFAVMAATGRHTYQVLTKRPHRMRAWLAGPGEAAVRAVLAGWAHERGQQFTGSTAWIAAPDLAETITWPLPNVWVGVSAETQDWAHTRIPVLLDTPAAIHWVSAEPLLGPLDLRRWLPTGHDERTRTNPTPSSATGAEAAPALDWVVTGGESGPDARPVHPDWIHALRDQCATAGVAFHFKQWGEWAPVADHLSGMTRVGKRTAGRVLDGRTHDAYPTSTSSGGRAA